MSVARLIGRFWDSIDRLLRREFRVPVSWVYAEKAKLDIVAENMREGAILLDTKLNVLFVNPAARVMLNVPLDEASNTAIFSAFKKKFPHIDFEKCVSHAAPGNPFHIPEVESDSEVYQIYFSKLLKEEYRRYKAEVLVWIEDITEAKTLERRKSEFVSVVAHQLRTPLSGLKWTLHMLINGDLGPMTDDQKTFLLKSYENNERMITLVNDMLAADRIESGRLKYNLLRIDMRDLVENVLFEVFPLAQQRSVKIDFNPQPDAKFLVLVDPTKIRAVIQNLLENAIKYTIGGGNVNVKLEIIGSNTQVSIQDTGIGIPRIQQSQIFTRFFRAGNAVRVEPSGTGLGLYMVKKIVEQHSGQVRFESEEGKGSTFYVTIPLAGALESSKKI